MKTGKKFARRRKDFTKPRCSEPRTGFTDARGAARFRAKSRGFGKSIGVTCEQDIITAILSGFDGNRFFHDTAKQMRRMAYRLRLFHYLNFGGNLNMSVRNEIKAQIVRAGFTMQEVVDRLHDEYDWSDSVSNLSAKLQRESIRYKEVVELADALGYDLIWQKRREK